MEYRKFILKPGQQAPLGSTGQGIDDGILWLGEVGTFPKNIDSIVIFDERIKEDQDATEKEILIQQEIHQMAIDNLKTKNKLDENEKLVR